MHWKVEMRGTISDRFETSIRDWDGDEIIPIPITTRTIEEVSKVTSHFLGGAVKRPLKWHRYDFGDDDRRDNDDECKNAENVSPDGVFRSYHRAAHRQTVRKS